MLARSAHRLIEWQQNNLAVFSFFFLLFVYPAVIGFSLRGSAMGYGRQMVEAIAWSVLLTFGVALLSMILKVVDCYRSFASRDHYVEPYKRQPVAEYRERKFFKHGDQVG